MHFSSSSRHLPADTVPARPGHGPGLWTASVTQVPRTHFRLLRSLSRGPQAGWQIAQGLEADAPSPASPGASRADSLPREVVQGRAGQGGAGHSSPSPLPSSCCCPRAGHPPAGGTFLQAPSPPWPGSHTAYITFLSLAAPVPERMASIKACLASTGVPRALALALGAVLEAGGGAGAARGGGRGRVGRGWLPGSPRPGGSGPCPDLAASRKLRSSSEAQDATWEETGRGQRARALPEGGTGGCVFPTRAPLAEQGQPSPLRPACLAGARPKATVPTRPTAGGPPSPHPERHAPVSLGILAVEAGGAPSWP